jgi:hypothetical protein
LEDCASDFVNTLAIADLESVLEQSKFLRFYYYYCHFKHKLPVNHAFLQFLELWPSFIPSDMVVFGAKNEMCNLVVLHQMVLEVDYNKEAAQSLKHLQIIWTEQMQRGGMLFHGRGWNCKEVLENRRIKGNRCISSLNSDNGYLPNLHCNKLSETWDEKKNRSSWCCYQLPIVNRDDRMTKESILYNYAQINCFGTIIDDEDIFLKKQVFAAITARRKIIESDLHLVLVDDFYSYLPTPRYIDVSCLHNTAVLVAPFSDTTYYKPYIENGKFRSSLANELCLNKNEVRLLCMIVLDKGDIMALDQSQFV